LTQFLFTQLFCYLHQYIDRNISLNIDGRHIVTP
jgi:hypothetical protein